MPLLRMSKECNAGLSNEIDTFLKVWKDEKVDRKRKQEFLENIRSKVNRMTEA